MAGAVLLARVGEPIPHALASGAPPSGASANVGRSSCAVRTGSSSCGCRTVNPSASRSRASLPTHRGSARLSPDSWRRVPPVEPVSTPRRSEPRVRPSGSVRRRSPWSLPSWRRRGARRLFPPWSRKRPPAAPQQRPLSGGSGPSMGPSACNGTSPAWICRVAVAVSSMDRLSRSPGRAAPQGSCAASGSAGPPGARSRGSPHDGSGSRPRRGCSRAWPESMRRRRTASSRRAS